IPVILSLAQSCIHVVLPGYAIRRALHPFPTRRSSDLSNLTRHQESLAEARAGIALIAGRQDPASLAMHARLLSGLVAAPASDLDQGEDRRTLGREAVELAERSGDDQALATAATSLAWAAADAGDLEDALGSAHRVASMATDTAFVLNAAIFESDVLVRLGRYDEAIAAGAAAIE